MKIEVSDHGSCRRIGRTGFAVGLLLAGALALPRPSAASDALDGDHPRLINGVIATIDGEAVTLRDLRQYRKSRAPFLPAEVGSDLRTMFEALLDSRLLAKEVEKNGVQTSQREVDAYIANVLRNQQTTREQLEVALAEAGVTWDDYNARMREEVQRFTLVNLLIRSRVNVSPEEVERSWETDPRYLEPEKVEIADIFLAYPPDAGEAERSQILALATQVYDKAKGRGFAKMAAEYSDGPGADEGGNLGRFERSEMAPLFRDAIATLDDGEVSRPVVTDTGIHLVKLVKTVKPERVPLDGVREEIHDRIYEERLDERYARWAREDLRAAHHVIVMLEELAILAAS